ncbi:MAG: hypothetical protein HZLCBSQH_000441 [Candidatus Fervidibacterota bacterium]
MEHFFCIQQIPSPSLFRPNIPFGMSLTPFVQETLVISGAGGQGKVTAFYPLLNPFVYLTGGRLTYDMSN